MKYINTFENFQIINKVNEAKSIEEVDLILSNLNENVLKKIKKFALDKVSKLKSDSSFEAGSRFSEEDKMQASARSSKAVETGKIRDINKENEFIDLLSIKLFGKANKIGQLLGHGMRGDVYNIGSSRVLKIGIYKGKEDSQFYLNSYLKEHPNPHIAKIYQNGLILVSNRFKDRQIKEATTDDIKKIISDGNWIKKTIYKNLSDTKLGEIAKEAIEKATKERYFFNKQYEGIKSQFVNKRDRLVPNKNYSQYTLMEKVNVSKQLKQDLFFLYISYITYQKITNRALTKMITPNIFKLLSGYQSIDDYKKHLSVRLLLKPAHKKRLFKLLDELRDVLLGIAQSGIDWEDIHYNQFGRNKSGKLIAFDVDGANAKFSDSTRKYWQPKNIIREKKEINFSI